MYGCLLKVCIVGYLRPEMNFDSLESLIEAIRKDISDTEELLQNPEYLKFQTHEFFTPEQINGHQNANGHL